MVSDASRVLEGLSEGAQRALFTAHLLAEGKTAEQYRLEHLSPLGLQGSAFAEDGTPAPITAHDILAGVFASPASLEELPELQTLRSDDLEDLIQELRRTRLLASASKEAGFAILAPEASGPITARHLVQGAIACPQHPKTIEILTRYGIVSRLLA